MGKRITRVVTRTGDDGTTRLAGGERLAKHHPRIDSLGSVDELNSAIGLLRAAVSDDGTDARLEIVQHRLFDLGGELAMPGTELFGDERVAELESWIDADNARLPPLEEFVLPAGSEATARCHLARAICRRAERDFHRIAQTEAVNAASGRYLNRLSDLLFVLARVLARRDGGREVTWRKDLAIAD